MKAANPKPCATAFAFALLAALATPAGAEPPRAASTEVDAGAPQAGSQPFWGADIPSEPSHAPSRDEWKRARTVTPLRGTTHSCELLLVREWLKMTCSGAAGAGLVAGDPKGVDVSVVRPDDSQSGEAAVVLPVRRGESKIVSFLGQEWEHYGGPTFFQMALLSVVWRTGRPYPVLVVR